MLSRLEYKYLVPVSLLSNIRSEVLIYSNYDPYADIRPNKEYTVRSIYLDTMNLHCYWEKLDGYKIRNKFRIGVYNEPKENSLAFLEIKRKNENFISKNRAKLYLKDLLPLLQAKKADEYLLEQTREDSELEEANRFLFHYYSKQLFPSTLVVYEREAFMGKFGYDLRITFDKNLRGSIKPSFNDFYSEENLTHPFRDFFILEIKFHQKYPAWIPQMIIKYGLQRISVSKYTNCIDINHKQMRLTRMLAF